MNIVGITQARTNSTRLPGKVLLKILDKTFLEIHLERLKKSQQLTKIIVATTINENDIEICKIAEKLKLEFYRGSETNVLERYFLAAKKNNAEVIIRITSDCPLIDATILDDMTTFFLNNNFDYLSNTFDYTYPDGLDIEIMTFSALKTAYQNAILKSDKEHVTPFIKNNSDLKGGNTFKAYNYNYSKNLNKYCRLTLDEESDFNMFSALISNLGIDRHWLEYVSYLQSHPAINNLNNHISSNEGYTSSLNHDAANN